MIFPKYKVGTTFKTQWGFFTITKRPWFGCVYEGQSTFTDDRVGQSAPESCGITNDNNAWLLWKLHEGDIDKIHDDFPLVIKNDKDMAALNELLHEGIIEEVKH